MKITGVIPARYSSTRFPGKVLADIHGKPMVQHVYEKACQSHSIQDVLVATDDERILQAVEEFGGKAVMTSPEHKSGTDRVAEAVSHLEVDYVVNIQGDEPMLDPVMLDELAELLTRDPAPEMATLVKEVFTQEEFEDPAVVKAVADAQGNALYFSRSLIPFPRVKTPDFHVYEHLGLYGYSKECLLRFTSLPPSRLELIEGLEQLRALENGIDIRLAETSCRHKSVSVDTPEDLETVRQLLAEDLVRK